MTVLEIVARTFSVQLPDGRLIFRPWGARGPCYLLTPQQRTVRAWIQLAFYVLALAPILFAQGITSSAPSLITFVVAFTLLNYVLFWLFSIGLTKTEKPPAPIPEQRRTAIAAHSRSLGRPLLWVLAIASWLFTLAGGIMVLLLREWATGLLAFVFFGACASLFTWQLWLIRKSSNV